MLFAFSHCGLRIERPEAPKKITDYEIETARYEALTQDPRPATAAEAYLQLAWLYVNHSNPKRSYPKALETLNKYGELEPEKAKEGNVRNWLAVLQEMSQETKRADSCAEELDKSGKESKRLKTRSDQLSREVADLREANDQLQKKYQKQQETIEKLQETIEKLKHLDLQLEEKRRKSIK
ncbi:MAG TPA: hypothetical protein VN260_09020 [Dissulfurispiraceae bacterium]|nr:hypothetical protein [Dissulfurispiraceae bacterium]